MLCNKTMRAALAPVIGLLASFVVATASAEIKLTPTTASPGDKAKVFASESLSTSNNAGTAKEPVYQIAATDTDLLITATTDILLEANAKYYVRYDFDGAGVGFTADLATASLRIADYDTANSTLLPAVDAEAIGYKGNFEDDMVIFVVPIDTDGYDRKSQLSLDLTHKTPGRVDGDRTPSGTLTGAQWRYDFGMLGVTGAGSVTAKVGVYASLTDARNERDVVFSAGPKTVLTLRSAVGGDIIAIVPPPAADVGAQVADDNGTLQNAPFRRFTLGHSGTAESAVLATTKVTVNKSLLDAANGDPVTDALVTGVTATATSAAGNFAVVSAADGGVITTNKKPWKVSSSLSCSGSGLSLMVEGAKIDTYEKDPDGKEGPRSAGDITPAGLAAANKAVGGGVSGDGYFCVSAKDNENAITRVSGSEGANAYMLTLEPQTAGPVKPAAIGPKAGGWIDRNGTTVNLTYLSTHEAYNQRLVIVNRGSESADFLVDDLQLEDGVTEVSNTLGGTVPANGRLVLRVQDHLTLDGKTRGAATVNVVAPVEDIDVMTIQVHPGTGQIDTTMYEAQ